MKRLLTILLSIYILFASLGMTISSHICAGKNVEAVMGIGSTDLSCGMVKLERSCDFDEQFTGNCCQNVHQHFNLEENIPNYISFNFNAPLSFDIFVLSKFCEKIVSIETTYVKGKDYPPPLIIKDIPILVESFLI